MPKSINFIFTLLIIVFYSCAHKNESIDLIIHNAKIYTMDEENHVFSAVAINNGLIVELGPEHQILNKYKANQTIDAQMKPVFPGFIDAHSHFIGYGLSLQNINLVGTKSYQEVIQRVTDFKKKPNQTWIQGRGWDQNDWEEKKYPNNEQLNTLFPNTPVILRRIDGHAALVNQKALDLAKITSETRLDNGEILVENGKLTGVLIDGAVDLVLNVIPPPSNKLKKQAILEAQQNCFSVGLTTVDDCGISKSEVFLLDSLQKNGELNMRVYAMLTDSKENFDFFLKKGPFRTNYLNVNAFKFYADGSLGSRGAALLKPYSDSPNHSGYMMNDKSYYLKMGKKVYNAGFQMCTHCIGDSANREILDVYSQILPPNNDRKWRIEHAQVVNPDDLIKFKKYSIIPSVQPTHATSDMYWAKDRLGEQRVKTAYAYKQLKDQLGLVALGTDFPIEDISPIKTFYAAVFRKDKNGFPPKGFQTENTLSREDAIRGMTIWAALSNDEFETKGSIEKGKFADLVMLDRDILSIDEKYILDTKVLYTVLAGQVVYSK